MSESEWYALLAAMQREWELIARSLEHRSGKKRISAGPTLRKRIEGV